MPKAVDVELKEVEEGLVKLTVTPVKPRESFRERQNRRAAEAEVREEGCFPLLSPEKVKCFFSGRIGLGGEVFISWPKPE